jgi:hypothetical protein
MFFKIRLGHLASFFFTNKINVHSMSTNLVYTLLCCLSLNFDLCICSVFMIQVSAYIWNHPSTGCIRVCQDHTKSQIIAGAIIVKQLVKKQFTYPNLNIFSIFFFLWVGFLTTFQYHFGDHFKFFIETGWIASPNQNVINNEAMCSGISHNLLS